METVEIQIVKYKIGGNYNWHCDYGLSQNPNADRKLSLSIQLSDEYEYDGSLPTTNWFSFTLLTS